MQKNIRSYLKILNLKKPILTGDGLVTSCTQGSSLGMIMCLAIRQSLMIEEGAALKLLSAILK